MLEEGDLAPDFSLPAEDGTIVSLDVACRTSDVILFFYPDATPGSVREAQLFRATLADVTAHGAIVIGINTDSLESHAAFRDRYGLPFHLLTDIDARVCDDYGVWSERSFEGRNFGVADRATFWIGRDRRVMCVWRTVDPTTHAHEVLAALEAGMKRTA